MRLVFCAFLLFVWVGCGGGGAPSGTKEGVGGDVLADVINDIPVTLNETRDELEEGLEVWDINELEEIGGLVECSTSQDCPSSVCVLAPDGKKYCAPFCVDEPCPEGWECTQITPVGGDRTFVCLPKATYLCRPCVKNEDCAPAGLLGELDCIAIGKTGKFCLPKCDNCPSGFSCSRGGFDHCLPESGQCECTDEFIKGG